MLALRKVLSSFQERSLHDSTRVGFGRPREILDPRTNIVHMRRGRVFPIDDLEYRERDVRSQLVLCTERAEGGVQWLVDQVLKGGGAELIASDVCSISELVRTELGCQEALATLEVVTSTRCPRLHADHVGVRLLCTYRGAGTIYVENKYVQRHYHHPTGDWCVHQELRAGGQEQVARVGDLLFLKGNRFPGNLGRGAVHRSPTGVSPQQPRLLLTLDLKGEGLEEDMEE